MDHDYAKADTNLIPFPGEIFARKFWPDIFSFLANVFEQSGQKSLNLSYKTVLKIALRSAEALLHI